MGKSNKPDLSEKWQVRLERIRLSQARTNTRGMTRPPRDWEEREFLKRAGQGGPFVEAGEGRAEKG